MATGGQGENSGTGEPLVGSGSARRIDLGPGSDAPVVRAGAVDDGAGGRADDGTRANRGRTPRSVPRPPLSRSRRRGRRWWLPAFRFTFPNARFALGLGLVVVLGVAWVAVGQRGSDGAAPLPYPSAAPRPVTATTALLPPRALGAPVASVRPVAVPRWVPSALAATCRARASAPANVVVDCTPGRGVISLQYRGFASVGALRTAYASASARRGGLGPSACARGAPEERSWSAPRSPGSPTAAIGRYRCSLAKGRAQLVWSSEQTGALVLAIASRADGDLRSLYQWWTSVPGPTVTAE
jgi:hypothetical protein